MGTCSIFVRSVFTFLVLAFVASLVRAQDPPKLPPDNSPPPDLSRPPFAPTFVPRVAVRRIQGIQGSGPWIAHCPRGYHFRTASKHDACVKGGNSCFMIWPLGGLVAVPGFSWNATLCDAKPVVRTRVDPVYPPDSIRDREQGTAEFRIVNRPDGSVRVWPTSAGFRLEAAGRTALQKWHWKPYLIEGDPVLFSTHVYFKFELMPDGPRVQTFLRKPPQKSR